MLSPGTRLCHAGELLGVELDGVSSRFAAFSQRYFCPLAPTHPVLFCLLASPSSLRTPHSSFSTKVMLRIGGNCPANELKQWHCWEKETNRFGEWINSVELLLDETQPTYRDRGEDHPNTFYHSVVSAFNDEVGGWRAGVVQMMAG